jgi:hypothetical protein
MKFIFNFICGGYLVAGFYNFPILDKKDIVIGLLFLTGSVAMEFRQM